MKKIKKVIFILFIIVSMISPVFANEYHEITDDIEIRYRWYKEVIVGGDYYPLKDITKEDIIDKNNIKYVGKPNVYSQENCFLPTEYYLLKEKTSINYTLPYPASYVLIENIDYNDNIKVYYNNKLLNYDIVSYENKMLKINLINERYCDKLAFYIETDSEYTIRLYRDLGFKIPILSKTIKNISFTIPDSTWTKEEAAYHSISTDKRLDTSDLTTYIAEATRCAYQEKYVYKYEIAREYYDDQYHLNVDNYIKDEDDYKVYYKGEPLTNTIEIIQEKIVEVPKVEYVYIENNKYDSSQPEEQEREIIIPTITKINKEFVEKEVFKIPNKVYIIILSLLIIIIFLIIKLYKKYVEQTI